MSTRNIGKRINQSNRNKRSADSSQDKVFAKGRDDRLGRRRRRSNSVDAGSHDDV